MTSSSTTELASTRIEWFDAAGKRLGRVELPGDSAHVRLDYDGRVVTPVAIEPPKGAMHVVAWPIITIREAL